MTWPHLRQQEGEAKRGDVCKNDGVGANPDSASERDEAACVYMCAQILQVYMHEHTCMLWMCVCTHTYSHKPLYAHMCGLYIHTYTEMSHT